MLALTRNQGESIVCRTKSGEEITITVTESSRGRAKLAIDAPESVRILRKELIQRKGSSNAEGND